ncbi:hypothetical protein Afil01_61150 [Actinorhabdospora filicis]|uniref:AB hydrolase-1 domain-containing protein n=1 Tax=Actinorhabdospora filicis TaxID=1785913 RepID=A0A9W6WCQ0_9ACTN|nr:alpha/beta hydrolase [Actinorhabdospora filicis]GLZ81308.1 hypothetical protein Afil01_61150 [Actinorhabdospora filicis]
MTENQTSPATDSTTPTAPTFGSSAPPLGAFAEIDGRRVFVHREGEGGPAVVFLPGASAIGLNYYGLQRRVAEFTTAVIYDRGGSGYSDSMPLPRSAEDVATELRDLLHAQDIPAPYVLVAHSLGGAYAQRFAQLFPDEVAGLVWLDAFHSDWDDYMPEEASIAAGERMAPPVEQLRQALPFIRDFVAETYADYPADLRDAVVDYHQSETWVQVGHAERGTMTPLVAELKAGPGFPDVPLIALTPLAVDPNQAALMSEETLQAIHDGKTNLYQALADSVPHGEHRVLTDANHSQLITERADTIIEAIRDIVTQVNAA